MEKAAQFNTILLLKPSLCLQHLLSRVTGESLKLVIKLIHLSDKQ